MAILGGFLRNRVSKKLGINKINKKVDQIDKKVSGIAQKLSQGGTNQVNPADALTIQPTNAGPGIDSTEDVSQTMIDPTQVQEGMVGDQDEILDDSTSALTMLKNMVRNDSSAIMHTKSEKHSHEKPQWKIEQEAKFEAEKAAHKAEKARLLKITNERRKKIYGK